MVNLKLNSGDPICPKCNSSKKTLIERIVVFSNIIFQTIICNSCNYEWRRGFYYVGLSPSSKSLNAFEQQAEVILLLKQATPNLIETVETAPKEYKNYVRDKDLDDIDL